MFYRIRYYSVKIFTHLFTIINISIALCSMCGKTFINVLASLAPPLRGGRHPQGAPFKNLLFKNPFQSTF